MHHQMFHLFIIVRQDALHNNMTLQIVNIFEMIFSLQQFKDVKCRNYVTVEFISILIVINIGISATSITVKIYVGL